MSEKHNFKETILNIPQPTTSCTTPSAASRSSLVATPTSSRATPTAPASEASEDLDPSEAEECEDGIGEFDDGRSGKITLGVLIQDGVIEAGEGVMAVDYLGQTFKGDLMPNGKIKSQETGLVFNNPSAWAIYCKKIVNPSKKSGCGERWASVKYKGRKMDQFKTIWAKMKAKKEADEENAENSVNDENISNNSETNNHHNGSGSSNSHQHQLPIILRHNQLAPKHPSDKTSILIDVDSFQTVGKIQPFTVSISSSALLIIDLHSHMIHEPVCGYLAGHWDLNAHNLAITHTFPCLTSPEAKGESPQQVEAEIYSQIYGRHLSLAGWYRSCPGMPALPSLKDSETQLEFQLKLLGNSDSTYTPCLGLMASPFTSMSNESSILTYWVIPPPDTIPVEYGRPMKMTYSIVTDPCLSAEILTQITVIIQYYKNHPERVDFTGQFNSDTKFITKMGRTLLPKFPRDQDERLWSYIRKLILGPLDSDADDPLLIRPLPNGVNNGSNSRRNSSRRQTHDEDEEEIDDDEENALKTVRNGSCDMSTPPVPTEDVISMLLHRQQPVNSQPDKSPTTIEVAAEVNQDDASKSKDNNSDDNERNGQK